METMSVTADPSTRLLSEVARHVVIPEGIVDTVWFDVEERCREWGDDFDVWQDGLGQLTLGLRADGKYAATVGGVTFSIPRQVAKTFIVGRIVFGLSTLFPNTTALWTAHRLQTTTMTFQKLAAFAKRPAVAPYLAVNRSDGIRTTNGQQEIEFRNGSKIIFGAREQGFGRGFDEVDIEVFDEAQILTEKALEDMVPAANQSRNPHGALLIFMGTPPRPTDPGEVFTGRRGKAIALKSGGVVVTAGKALYIETSADPDVGKPGGPSLDDPRQVALANPSYPIRTPQESIDRMRENLPSDEAWRREALGVWDDERGGSRAISATAWDAVGVPDYPTDGVPSYGVAFSQDGTRMTLAGAFQSDEIAHLEVIDAINGSVDQGLTPLADWFVAESAAGGIRWKGAASIVLSGSAGASVLKQLLIERRVPARLIRIANTPQYLAACGMLDDSVKAKTVTHRTTDGQKALDDSISIVDRDKRGGWVATVVDGDETPAEAVSIALWGARTTKKRTNTAVFR